MFDHYEWMGWGGAMGIVWLLVLAVLVVVLLGWLRSGRAGDEAPSAREILDRRYARGEISREEYQQRLEDLQR
jgi:putative membrane protein